MEVKDLSGRTHSLRLRPYRTEDNKIEGVVMVLVDQDLLRLPDVLGDPRPPACAGTDEAKRGAARLQRRVAGGAGAGTLPSVARAA